jgi:hypothetical protein
VNARSPIGDNMATPTPAPSLTNFLSGYKTYITSFVTAVTAIAAYLDGDQKFSTAITSVPGALLFLSATAASLRAALGKIEAKLK